MKEKTKGFFKKLYKIFIVLFLVILIMALGFNIYAQIRKSSDPNYLPKAFGLGMAIVVSGSMVPEINIDDIIIIKEASNYYIGDDITFKEGETYITHRVIEVTDSGYITKGINNDSEDSEILESVVEGKVILVVPKVGTILRVLKTTYGMVLLLLIFILITISNYLIKFLIRKLGRE